jgi:uncharacterized phiE125 gp8 family phage protein
MNMISRDAVVLDSAMLDEAKAYLRLETDDEDAPLGAIILAAIGHSETFLGLMLVRRGFQTVLPACSDWKRLGATPVASITGVTGLPAEVASFALPVGAYAIDIDASGDGWVRVTAPGSAGRVQVAGVAGMAADWSALPESIRLGVLRLIGHLYANRDGADDRGPPAAVAALLRPWRRMRIS